MTDNNQKDLFKIESLSDFWNALNNASVGDLFSAILRSLVKARNKKDLTELHKDFKKVFGAEGAEQVIKACKKLGSGIPGHKETVYDGVIFSPPLTGYMMRRALRTHTPDEAYKIYIDNVNSFVGKENKNIEQRREASIKDKTKKGEEIKEEDLPQLVHLDPEGYPPAEHLDMITEWYLERLDNIYYTRTWKEDKPLNDTDLQILVNQCIESPQFEAFHSDALKKDRGERAAIRDEDADILTAILAKAVLHLVYNDTLDQKELQEVADDIARRLCLIWDQFIPEDNETKTLDIRDGVTVNVPSNLKPLFEKLKDVADEASQGLESVKQLDIFEEPDPEEPLPGASNG